MFLTKFFHINFSSRPNIPENLVIFFRVLAKLDHLACNKFSKLQLELFNTIGVKQESYYMPNGLTSKIHNKIAPNFQGC